MTPGNVGKAAWAILLAVAPGSLALASPPADQPGIPAAIRFSSDLSSSLEDAGRSGRPLIVAFFAAWCPHCRRMRETTLVDPDLVREAQSFDWVLVDIDSELTVARSYGVNSVPQLHVLYPDGRSMSRVIGDPGPARLVAFLTEFLSSRAEHGASGSQGSPMAPGSEESAESQESTGPPDSPRPAQPPGHSEAPGPSLLVSAASGTTLIWTPEGYRGLSICFSHVGYGPLKIQSQSPFQALRLSLLPRTPSTLARGQWEVGGSGTWVNVWGEENGEYLLDYEMLQTAVTMAHGLTDTVQIEAALVSRSRFGGEMDGFVQGFHNVFGIDQGGRDEVPKGDFSFRIEPGADHPGVSLDSGDRGVFSTSLQVSLQHTVTCGTRHLPAFSYAVTVRSAPWNSPDLEGSQGLDLGFSVALARRFGRFYLYETLGYAWFGGEEFRQIALEKTQWTSLTALEWRFAPRMSAVAQYLLTTGAASDLGAFSDPSNEITFGWKWEVAQNTLLEAGLIENVITFDNSPDFGFHAGITHRFGDSAASRPPIPGPPNPVRSPAQ